MLAHVLLRITPFLGESGPHLTLGYLDPLELAPPPKWHLDWSAVFAQVAHMQAAENMPTTTRKYNKM